MSVAAALSPVQVIHPPADRGLERFCLASRAAALQYLKTRVARPARVVARARSKHEALWEALRNTRLAPDMHGFEKKRTVAELMRQHLLARGARYRTADGRLLFFSHEECRLYDPQETSFTQGLLAASGLATTAPVFNFARDMLTAPVARHGTVAEIHPL